MWYKSRSNVSVDEVSVNDGNSLINSLGTNRGRMLAERLVLSYPVWKGGIEVGEEFVSSRFSSDYATDAEIINDANTRVDEKNIAGFLDFRQTFGRFNLGAGLSYGVATFSRDITHYVCVKDLSRSFYLTLQYTFNSSRDRYKGRGAGANEKNRF